MPVLPVTKEILVIKAIQAPQVLLAMLDPPAMLVPQGSRATQVHKELLGHKAIPVMPDPPVLRATPVRKARRGRRG